jgi:hypothetical protein
MAPGLLVVGAVFLVISIYAAVRAGRNGDGGWMAGIIVGWFFGLGWLVGIIYLLRFNPSSGSNRPTTR